MTRIDTDSLFLRLGKFIRDYGIDKEKWEVLPQEKKIEIVLKISKYVETYVNDRSYHETQVGIYNSQVPQEEFSIKFKQEIVCKQALFVCKKKYGYHVVNSEGIPKDKIDVKGLEIVRSETPSLFREALKELLTMILKGSSDGDVIKRIGTYKKQVMSAKPEEISANIGVKGFVKYIVDGKPVKGCPWHVKGVANYKNLLTSLGIDDKYPEIEEGNKAKVVYVTPNPYGIEVVSYLYWPKEFTKAGVVPDYKKMLDKFFIEKIRMLLEPMKKEHLLETNRSALGHFFGKNK